MKIHSADRAHFHANWGTYSYRIDKDGLRGSHSLIQCTSASQNGHAHKTRTALTSKQSMILYIVTVSDDAALLITAMRGNVEHPSEDAAVRQKYVFIRRPITRVYCCFPRANLMTTTTAIKRNERIGNAKRRQAS